MSLETVSNSSTSSILTHNPTKTAEDISVILNNLERYTHRGMWWVRLDRVREEFEHLQQQNERYRKALEYIKDMSENADEEESPKDCLYLIHVMTKQELSPSPQ